MERYKGVDREKVLAGLREKYPEIPEPGTKEWPEFLKRLKEENPEDYRAALLLGGGITKALEKEIQRAKRRDAVKSLWNRLFNREHKGKTVPDKRKIGLLIFTVVGGLFLLAFFVGTAPKKEATGGGVVKGIPVSGSKTSNPTPSVSLSTENMANNTEAGKGQPSPTEKGLADMLNSSSSKTDKEGNASSSSGGASSPGGTTQGSASGNPGTTPGTLPPPPAPVYSGGALPPPPDTSYAATGGAGMGQAAVLPPPMVIYADPGMGVASPASPQGAGNTPQTTGTPPEPTGSTGTPSELPGGMLYLNYPNAGMMVVTIPQQGGINASSQPSEPSSPSAPSPSPASSPYPQNAPMPPTPPNSTGGNGW